jgi:hypothetical protein
MAAAPPASRATARNAEMIKRVMRNLHPVQTDENSATVKIRAHRSPSRGAYHRGDFMVHSKALKLFIQDLNFPEFTSAPLDE